MVGRCRRPCCRVTGTMVLVRRRRSRCHWLGAEHGTPVANSRRRADDHGEHERDEPTDHPLHDTLVRGAFYLKSSRKSGRVGDKSGCAGGKADQRRGRRARSEGDRWTSIPLVRPSAEELLRKALCFQMVEVRVLWLRRVGVAVQTGVLMTVYLHEALDKRLRCWARRRMNNARVW
jgi:hypothetical protein